MIYIIDLLILCNIFLCQPGISDGAMTIAFIAHLVLVMIAALIDSLKDDKIKKLENTIDEHLRWHMWEDNNDQN